jgi:Fic family protein
VWPPDPSAYGSKVARRGGPYEVFVPASIAARPFVFDNEAVGAIADATDALATLAASPGGDSVAALAGTLLRSESVASSRIENVRVSHKRLARAAYYEDQGARGDRKAAEVLGNLRAMQRAIALGERPARIGVDDVLDVHRTLLRYTEDEEIAGVLRTEQNWIGGNDFNPVGADYVPPPHELVAGLLEDLCAFIARDDIAPIAQAAIAHAQFENIHPFVDGNGRTGRALIYSVLKRRGAVGAAIPPISLALGGTPKAYTSGFGSYSAGKADRWCELFSNATVAAARIAEDLIDAVQRLQASFLDRLGQPRSDSAARQIVALLPGQPVIDVAAVRETTGKSHVAVGAAIQSLEDAGVLQPIDDRRRGRAWECGELLDLLGSFEKRLWARRDGA